MRYLPGKNCPRSWHAWNRRQSFELMTFCRAMTEYWLISAPGEKTCQQTFDRLNQVIIHSHIITREVLILTLSILLALQGCISWYIPRDGLMMREWPYTASNRDELGCTSPPTSRCPSDFALRTSFGLGKSLGRRGCTTQYIPPLGSVRIQYTSCPLKFWFFQFLWDIRPSK